jgi:hypothetical protein
MRRRGREWLGAGVIAVVVGGVMVLAPENPYAEELAQARQVASPFQLEVLSDNRITDEELADARQRWEECQRDPSLVPPGYEGTTDVPGMDPCYASTLGGLEELAWEMSFDPQHRGPAVVLAECLQRYGLLPADYEVISPDLAEAAGDILVRVDTADDRVRACFFRAGSG